jgi:hypothetical protein
MGIVCSACKHVNGFGSLSCSNCGKGLFDENGTESFSDIRVGSEPRTLTSKKNGNRPLLIGLMVAGALILVIVVTGIFHGGSNSGAGTETVTPTNQVEDTVFLEIRADGFTEADCNQAIQAATDSQCGPDKDISTITPAEDDRHFECVKGLEYLSDKLHTTNARPHTCAAIMFGCPNTGTYVTDAPGIGSAVGCAGVGGKDQ